MWWQALQFIDLSVRLVITLVIRHSSHSTPLICIRGTCVAAPLFQRWCFLTASIKIFSAVDSRGATRQQENNQMIARCCLRFSCRQRHFLNMQMQQKGVCIVYLYCIYVIQLRKKYRSFRIYDICNCNCISN